MWTTRPYRQAVELQQLLLRDARSSELKPVARAALARAFVELEECKRKLRMRPLPKSVDVSKLGRSKQSTEPVFTES